MPESEKTLRRGLAGRLVLELREDMSALGQTAIVLGGVLAGLVVSVAILVVAGVPLPDLMREFAVVLSGPRNLASVLGYAAPLTVVGLAAAWAFRARFWNIGIEGQMILGAIGATLVANLDLGPEGARLWAMALAAAAGGMAWIALPLLLKLRLGVNEIISTLLMNYIAFNLLLHLLYGPWKDPDSAFPNSKLYDPAEQLPGLGWESLDASVPVAVALVLASLWALGQSRLGFLIGFLSANPRMARALGVQVGLVTLVAALASGALSGLAGFVISAGVESRMTQSFFVGYGFSGILIGFLSRNNPLAVVAFAAMIAVLMVAGQSLQVFYQIPFAMVQLIQAIVVICAAASEFFIRHRIRIVD